MLDAFIYERIRVSGMFSSAGVSPISILTIDDLEMIVRNDRIKFIQTLREWQADTDFPYLSLGGFASNSQEFNYENESIWYKENIIKVFNETCMTIFGRPYREP